MITIDDLSEMYGGQTRVLLFVPEDRAHAAARADPSCGRDLSDRELEAAADAIGNSLEDEVAMQLRDSVRCSISAEAETAEEVPL